MGWLVETMAAQWKEKVKLGMAWKVLKTELEKK